MPETCHVCGHPMSGNDVATCNGCGRRFHLAMTIQSTTADCGRVFSHPEHLYLVFLCALCDAQHSTRQ